MLNENIQKLHKSLIELFKEEETNEHKLKFYEKEINRIIEELCTLSKDKVSGLTSQQTEVLRKCYGINDDGICYNKSEIARELSISRERSRQVYIKAKEKLKERIQTSVNCNNAKINRMTSADILENRDEIYNQSLVALGISPKILERLENAQIYTIGELLQYSIEEIKLIIRMDAVESIRKKLQTRGLKYINDLTLEERKRIIESADIQKLYNSSICWIKMPSSFIKKLNNKYNIYTINELQSSIEEDKMIIEPEILCYANNIGIDFFGKKLFFMDKKVVSDDTKIDEIVSKILAIKISNLGVPTSVTNRLMRENITTVAEFMNYNQKELKKVNGIGKYGYNQLMSKIHELGLYCSGDIPKLDSYYGIVFEQQNHKIISQNQANMINQLIKYDARQANVLYRKKKIEEKKEKYEILKIEKTKCLEIGRVLDEKIKSSSNELNKSSNGESYVRKKKK